MTEDYRPRWSASLNFCSLFMQGFFQVVSPELRSGSRLCHRCELFGKWSSYDVGRSFDKNQRSKKFSNGRLLLTVLESRQVPHYLESVQLPSLARFMRSLATN